MSMIKDTQSIDSKVLRRIYGHGRGWSFTPTHFQDIGSRTAIDLALMRHTRSKTIQRLGRGLYLYPTIHPRLGVLIPEAEAIAQALVGRDKARLQPSGAYAANLLGLSDQVPMKIVFLTDGPSRHVLLGKQNIFLRRTTPKNMATAGRVSGLVIQALRHLGRGHVDESIINHLKKVLSEPDKKILAKDIRYAPISWIAEVMREIVLESDS